MEFIERNIPGVYEIILHPHSDERGFFSRTYDVQAFSAAGLHRNWVQENHSLSIQKNTIRGLHFQLPPSHETKLVRCISGTVFDVFVDLRKDSPTFGKWDGIELSGENMKMVFIPPGIAHGFCTRTGHCNMVYKVDNFYNPEHERGLLWNDPALAIEWECKEPILSAKDRNNLLFADFINTHGAIELK